MCHFYKEGHSLQDFRDRKRTRVCGSENMGKEETVVNYYNPCWKLEEIEGQDSSNIVWCGDFNRHIRQILMGR